eukprot:scaffold29650_cov44-Cyclotella_meneghiniana.AAC.1
MEHNNAQASDSKEVSKQVVAAVQDASAVAPTKNPADAPADAPNKASSPSTTGSASATASVAPNQQSATSTATASVAASAVAIAPNQKSAAAESTAASSTATASAPPTELNEAAAAVSRGFHDDGSGDPPSCSTPMTSNKTSPPVANNQLYSPQQPFFSPQPFQPIINHPAAVANQSPPRMRITQTQYSPAAFSPRSPNIDIQSYQHSISAKLNDPNNHHSTFEEVITHPSHPFGEQFWELAMKNTYLPNEFLGFDLLLDVFPMVYTILSNLQLGLIPKTNGGLNLNRSTHKNVDIMHVLPHTINKLVDNKVFRHLHSSSGGDGGGEDPDNGDDGGFDDLSSDEEDPDEKIHPGDEANIQLGYRESTKVQIKLSLSNNRKMAASLAVLKLFVEVITKVASAMSEHHYLIASKCRTLALFTDSVNRGEDGVEFNINELPYLQDLGSVNIARASILKQREVARKELSELRQTLQKLKSNINEMRQDRKPPSKRATASNTNPAITNVTRGSRTGEQHLLKWIDLLSQNGNSHDHQMARLLAYQCHEIATHPTFRPMYSDVCPTFICPPEKRQAKPPEFFKPGETTGGKKRKTAAKKENPNKDKKKKSGPHETESKSKSKAPSKQSNANAKGENTQNILSEDQCDLLGNSLCLNYPFCLPDYELIFNKSNQYSKESTTEILFPLRSHPPWRNRLREINSIVDQIHSLLEKAHSEKFADLDTIEYLVNLRKQIRLSYYTHLSDPINIPNDDRDFYIEQYNDNIHKHQADDVSEDDFVSMMHTKKMQTFIAQDSYDIIKTIYQDDAPPEHEILYVVGLALPPTMLDVTSFEGTVVTREHPNLVNLEENISNEDEEDEDESIDPSVDLNIKPVDVAVVRATPIYRPHFAQRFIVNDLVSNFPALTSTEEKEKMGCIEMGLVMILHNIDLTDGDSNKVFHVEGGNQLTRARNYLRSIGFLRIREPKDEEKSARLIRWNCFRGLEGLGLDDQFPINLRDCPMFGNYAHALPMSSHPEVAMVKYVNVIFISTPLDTNMSCKIHPGGCGWALNYGRPVKVDAGECQLIKGRIWNVAVREFSGVDEKHNVTLGCKVGIVRVLYNQLHLVANRSGIITHISHKPKDKTSVTINLQNMCCGTAVLTFFN